MVLTMLALLMILVLAALSTGTTHLRSASLQSDRSAAEWLRALPANMVKAQLKRATTQPAVLWTSQPGMIRTFGTDVAPGKDKPTALMHHRLYSAPVMNSVSFDASSETSAMAQWQDQLGLFVDLNEPMTNANGERQYPIADPARLGLTDGYALRDAAAGAVNGQSLPLPVAWMYLLKDGQLVMPTSRDSAGVHFDPTKVTAQNPVVARIAFWTDDESCKLNLNTASEAQPWDMPAANTLTEQGYAKQVPAAAQHHADSGHPAFTSLSSVLKHFGGGKSGTVQWPVNDPLDPLNHETTSWWSRHLNCYQSLVPEGTVQRAGEWVSKQERHYSSVGEFYLDVNRNNNGLAKGFVLSTQDLRQADFLLTTRSNAPELNPFGLPKIALWMMPKDRTQRTLADKRLHALSALDPAHEFMFQRAALWQSADGQGSAQSMSADWTEVPRNRELYAWLQRMTNAPIPGVGSSFVSKYGERSRDQILTSMLDNMRWSVNTDKALPPASAVNHHSAVPLTLTDENGSVKSRGYGRFPTITEVAVVFAFTDVDRLNGAPLDANNDGICDRAAKLRAFLVLNPYFAANGPAPVSAAWSVRIQRGVFFNLADNVLLKLPGGNVRNRCTLSNTQPLPATGLPWGGGDSAYACFASQFLQPDGNPKLIGKREDPARDFPFISSSDVVLPKKYGAPATSIRMIESGIVIDLLEPNAPPGQKKPDDTIHSVEVLFPAQDIPMPKLLVSDFAKGPRTLDDRLKPVVVDGVMRLPIIQRGDIVRSMVLNANGPTGGDARLLAVQRSAVFDDGKDNGYFTPHPDAPPSLAGALAPPQVQSLRDGAYLVSGQYGAPELQPAVKASGSLLAKLQFSSNAPLTLKSALQRKAGDDPGGRLGDWESGAGVQDDGASVNRCAHSPETTLSSSGITAPNAAMPMTSAISFGALPSGIFGDAKNATPRPWQTLLFCPNPAGRTSSATAPGRFDSTTRDHFGFANPHDHLWLEFFWRPITEPSALSANFATEGKVNLNFQILPWTWLRRATAMHGALQGVRMAAIPSTAVDMKKASTPQNKQFRYTVDAEKTLAAFESRFDAGEVFRTASEVCDMFLVPKRIPGHDYGTAPDPKDLDAAGMTTWWNGSADDDADAFEATGDNLRESPYAQLYPRLCTQSNIFRVHYRVQVLKKARGTLPDVFDDTRDSIVSERRGSDVIERRFKPTAPAAEPVTDAAAPSLHTQQEFITISRERFGS